MKALLYSLAVALGLSVGSTAYMAADPAIVSTTENVVLTIKDNVLGVIDANIANLIIVGVTILMIFFVWRFAKKFMGGR